jgi:hypothetical protein
MIKDMLVLSLALLLVPFGWSAKEILEQIFLALLLPLYWVSKGYAECLWVCVLGVVLSSACVFYAARSKREFLCGYCAFCGGAWLLLLFFGHRP